ncbi:MAG TPA: phytoene desaturase family protein [Pirellula sp.]|nr:phytoene desaturase family protein [Pirellula sp.]
MAKPRVVVIGAGPGGLASALQLVHGGAEVTVLEARSQVGGRCASIYANGFRFDTGPTFYLYPRILREIFQSVGRDIDVEIPMKRLDPQYRVSFGAGGYLDCTHDLGEMDRQIAEMSPEDVGALKKYLDHNRVKLAKFRPILESPFNSMLDLLRPSVLAAASLVKPWKTLGRDLQSYFRDPRLVIAFSFQAKYLGMSPFKCPSLFSILSFLEYEYGVFHPNGGCGQVSERMAEIAKEIGCEIRTDEAVESLEFKGKRVTAVVTSKGRYEADALVINADFASAMQKLVPDELRKRWSNAKIARKRFSCSTFMLYLGINGRHENLTHHTIHISKDYDRNLRQIEKEMVLPDDPSFYVQNPCVTDSSLAPEGKSTLYVLVPVPHLSPHTPWDEEQTQAFRETIFQKLAQIGLSDLRSKIEYEQIVTPANWRDDFSVYRGATFNLAHNLGQMLHLRPHNKFEELDGVYLVGGGTHPGSGLPVIYESSRITCKQLLPDIGLSAKFMYELAPIHRPEPVLV